MRLRCDGCNRNLADVSSILEIGDMAEFRENGSQVKVTKRPGVNMTTFHPTPVDATYSIHCRCGRQHDRRRDAIRKAWRQLALPGYTRVVYATLGTDV